MTKTACVLLGLIAGLLHGCSARCPEWAREQTPEWAAPYTGVLGMAELCGTPAVQPGVAGIDLWQANNFIIFRPRTAEHLYSTYTPLHVGYIPGTLPTYEKVAARYTDGLTSATGKTVALATRALIGERFLHPSIPPRGPACATDRGLEDEALLRSGAGWCNEQARVFVRLCQVSGIPARLVFLFYADLRSGHVVAEFYADQHWSMADCSWALVFPAADGHLMSAAECHEEGPNMDLADRQYVDRMTELFGYTDAELLGGHHAAAENTPAGESQAAAAAKTREWLRSYMSDYMGRKLWRFGLLNYPLPR